MRALLAPYDKTGLVEFARGLVDLGWELLATGGTEKALRDAGLPVTSVAAVTGSPEMLDGRVKTLHPAIHGGLLARRDNPQHMREMQEQGFANIDLVANNLYPFEATIARPDVTLNDALENIDIGGPAMLRAAAKNFPDVVVLCDPADYDAALAALRDGGLPPDARQALAAKAFQHVALYDTMVSGYLRGTDAEWPAELTVGLRRLTSLHYGENPHQAAVLYEEPGSGDRGIVHAQQLHGAPISFNNVLDADAAWRTVSDFEAPTVAVIKHTNPCGLASDDDLTAAYARALSGDPISAFGGIVACNRPIDGTLAQAMRASISPSSGQRMRYDIVVAPGFSEEALAALTRWRDARILAVTPGDATPYDLRRVSGGFLLQEPDQQARRIAAAARRQQTRADGGRARRSTLRLARLQAHQVERHRPREGQHAAGHGRRPAQPRHQRAPRRRARRRAGARQRPRLGRLLPLLRRRRSSRRGGRHCHHRAGRLRPRRGGRRPRGRGQHGRRLYGRASFQTLASYELRAWLMRDLESSREHGAPAHT